MSLVSVIIPNYNHAPYLNKRIDSILNQTYQKLELIILDDLSTDNSREVIESYNSPLISHTVFNDVNSGSPFIQWQKGFDLAKGDLIWVAESDDYADLTFLEKLLPELLIDDRINVVYSDSNQVDGSEVVHHNFYKKYRNKIFQTYKWTKDYQRNGIDELRENLFYDCTINNTSAMIFKKSLLKNVDFDYLQKFKYCGDWFFFISLMMQSKIAYKSEPLNYYRVAIDNFKPGTKSVLNYLKERFLARYYFWEQLRPQFSKNQRKRLYDDLGLEMRVQLSEMVRRKISFKETLSSFKTLYFINKKLFFKQFSKALSSYLRKK
ncbi:MAG: glycosyltransferase [Rickettsiales bacterium]|nr:MAG: glycosyltransferase [Rickettsiales bacterium]